MTADRSLPSMWYNPSAAPPPDFRAFFEASILRLLGIKGRGRKRRSETACIMVYNLMKAAAVNRAVARSRQLNEISRQERNLWDSIVAARLARMDRGGQWDGGTVTRYRATRGLIEMREHWGRELVWSEREATDFEFIRLHSGKEHGKKPIDLRRHLESIATPEGLPILLQYFCEIDGALRAFNEMNARHRFVAPFVGAKSTVDPDIRLTQIHSGQLWACARLCTSGREGAQSMPKEQRERLTIDGEPVVELDFVSCHPRLLYQLHELPAEGDLYRPERFFGAGAYENEPEAIRKQLRGIAKAVFTRANNNATESKAFGSLFAYAKSVQDGLPWKLRHFVADSNRADVLARALMDRLENAHPELASRSLLYKNWGFSIMFLESTILTGILKQFMKAEIPVLPIHDGLVVRRNDRRFARRTMLQEWERVVGAPGKVKVA